MRSNVVEGASFYLQYSLPLLSLIKLPSRLLPIVSLPIRECAQCLCS